MKKRNGFVSNSSSSSFIIILDYLSKHQIDMIMKHVSIGEEIDKELIKNGKEPKYEYYEEWNIKIDDFSLWASTSMDNFYLEDFIADEVKVDKENIIYIGDDWDYSLSDDEDYINLKRKHRLNKINKIRKK